jgi:hypothetical protein
MAKITVQKTGKNAGRKFLNFLPAELTKDQKALYDKQSASFDAHKVDMDKFSAKMLADAKAAGNTETLVCFVRWGKISLSVDDGSKSAAAPAAALDLATAGALLTA